MRSCQGTSSGNAGRARVAAHLRCQRLVLGLGPRLDRAFGQRQRLVRNHQVQIEIDGVAEALAARARAERIVEREQPRLRLFVADVALLALEALREAELLCSFAFARRSLEQHFARFAITLLHRIDDAQARVRRNRDAIDQHQHRFGEIQIEQRLGRGELDHLPVLIEPVVAPLAQLEQALLQQGIAAAFAALWFSSSRLRRPFAFSGAEGFGGGCSGKNTCTRVPSPSARIRSATSSTVSFFTS